MKLFGLLSLSMVLPAIMAMPAVANPTVTSPYNDSTVSSPFTLTANASSCSSQTVVSMGYSVDNGTDAATESGTSLKQSVSASTGGHTIHVKAWGKSGAVCVTDVSVKVSGTSSGNPSVSSPMNGATVASPFKLSASSSSCSGQAVSAMGYSVDNSPNTMTVNGTVLNTSVSIVAGGHTLHVKSWGKGGASCVDNIGLTVASTSSVPSGAKTISSLQALKSWGASHDAGTSGTSSGSTSITSSPSRSGSAREMATTYKNYGGERYIKSFSDDTSAHNFVYDAWVYVKDSAKGVKNLELDLNQVISNGWTVIMGFQCDGWSGTWDYTANKGTAKSPDDKWVHSSIKCDPRNWAVNAWHHIEIAYERDDYGYVTYKSVTFDGAKHALNTKVFSGFALGWDKTILTNFQVDGGTSYSYGSKVYLDDLNISYW